jgi:MOSC domain-containing protein YiiM/ferredoxin-NADP reductase
MLLSVGSQGAKEVVAVSVGQVRTVEVKGKEVKTSIYKEPLEGRCEVGPLGLAGDHHVEKRSFGDKDHAVYAYPLEHYAYWQRKLRDGPFPMGQFGENLTVRGLLEGDVRVGDIVRFGKCVLQIAHPRLPCRKLNIRMGLRFASTFLESGRLGYYMRVIEPGTVGAGDSIEVVDSDPNSPTMEKFIRVSQNEYWDTEGLEHLLRSRDLAPGWREILEDKLQRSRDADGWFGWREFEVFDREVEVADVVSLYLRCAQGKPLAPFHSGQYLMVWRRPEIGVSPVRRAYAISSSPQEKDYYRITVKHLIPRTEDSPEGVVSTFLSKGIMVGDRVRLAAPRGSFSSNAVDENCPGVLMVCRDIGIAPMMSMLRDWTTRGSTRPTFVVHYSRNSSCHIFRDDLLALQKENPLVGSRFVYAEPSPSDPEPSGELADEELKAHIPPAGGRIYVAGESKFVQEKTERLISLGAEQAQFVVERFGA